MLQCEIIGNIGNDAEIKDFGGKKYVSFNVAHSERKKDANGFTQITTWISVLWYGEGGGIFQYLKKGSKVFVRGHLSVKTYQDRGGTTQVAINVNANEVVLCGTKGEQAANNAISGQVATSTPAPARSQAASCSQDDPDDDLPF